jgi:guanine deaminase
MTDTHHMQYMQQAIELGRKTAFEDAAGGPFGCVIVKDNEVIAEGVNRVIAENDPTCHGEIQAIRAACTSLGTFDLSGSTMYTSSEPCPMCYAAAWWARIEKIYYASTMQDCKTYGDFDDSKICEALQHPAEDRTLPCIELLRDEMLEIWEQFSMLENRPKY